MAHSHAGGKTKGKVRMIVLPNGEEAKFHNVVTSFNEAGYERYGKAFIETFLEHWPSNLRLTVYYEGEKFPFTEGLSWKPIETVEYLPEYMASLRFPIMHGIVGNQYDINWDARMCRKVLIQMHALKQFSGKVFWMDADTITHSRVPREFLDDVLPDDKLCCYLGRDGWYYTESGFIGFNGKHPLAAKFYNNYVHSVVTGMNLTQEGWHDCYVFDAVRKIINQPTEFVNLAAGLPHGTMHPYVNSILGRYCDHRKGPRKEGRSTDKDLVIHRDEAYWTQQDSTAKT